MNWFTCKVSDLRLCRTIATEANGAGRKNLICSYEVYKLMWHFIKGNIKLLLAIEDEK